MTTKYYHVDEFSKRALTYEYNNFIQKIVAKKLLSKIEGKPKKILDLGSGSGVVYRCINWDFESFVGVDKAENMCKIHPKNEKVDIILSDFEKISFKEFENFDLIISSSSLQWSKDLDWLLKKISFCKTQIAFSIFCEGTFESLYKIANLNSFLPKVSIVLNLLKQYYNFEHEIVNYRLKFLDKNSLFKYIKKSGVSGGNRRLNFIQTKELIEKYPYDFLEFKVILINGNVL